MNIDKKQDGGCLTLKVEGRLDTNTSPELETALKASNPVFYDMIPLTLEEIFIYEMGGAAYEIKDVIL